jgi:hypothetical protein
LDLTYTGSPSAIFERMMENRSESVGGRKVNDTERFGFRTEQKSPSSTTSSRPSAKPDAMRRRLFM